MLAHRNEEPRFADQEIEAQFRKHLSVVKPWLVSQPNMEVLYLSYNEMMRDAAPFCRRVVDFLGVPLDIERMVSVPSKDLYRNRKVPA